MGWVVEDNNNNSDRHLGQWVIIEVDSQHRSRLPLSNRSTSIRHVEQVRRKDLEEISRVKDRNRGKACTTMFLRRRAGRVVVEEGLFGIIHPSQEKERHQHNRAMRLLMLRLDQRIRESSLEEASEEEGVTVDTTHMVVESQSQRSRGLVVLSAT